MSESSVAFPGRSRPEDDGACEKTPPLMGRRNERLMLLAVCLLSALLLSPRKPPPAAVMTRRTFSNICRHCWSRSSGTLPVVGSVPAIAPVTTNGPRRLALGIGLAWLAPGTLMLRLLSTTRLLR